MRLPDWEQRLTDYLGQHRNAVFTWGTLDCGMFAARAVETMTGAYPSSALSGGYSTKTGAMRALRDAGFADPAEAVSASFEEIAPAFAMRGDIVMVGGSLGVCAGRIAWFVGEDDGKAGLIPMTIGQWQRAWRVPFAA